MSIDPVQPTGVAQTNLIGAGRHVVGEPLGERIMSGSSEGANTTWWVTLRIGCKPDVESSAQNSASRDRGGP